MPLVTGVWESLDAISYNQPNQFQGTQIVLNPLTKASTGQTARQLLATQVTSFGLPLIGIYVSGSGSIPHFILHRSQFPTQTGNPEQRAEKLQTALQTALENIYKTTVTITDPTDPDFGNTVDLRSFWPAARVWNYRTDGLYTPRFAGVGDFAFRISDTQPPGNWWTERN